LGEKQNAQVPVIYTIDSAAQEAPTNPPGRVQPFGLGDIHITLLDAMALDLKSRDGDIVIPQALHVDIELRGDNVSVRGGPLNKGNISRGGVQGSLNDGGPLVRAKSNDGRIVLRLQ
jgi:hypothetical protein